MATIWELDFYSRPILDETNKKLWEVLICESPTQIDSPPDPLFQYAEYCPNSQVNSLWLAQALEAAMAKAGQAPDRIRFFRQAMNNMITKACADVGIPAQPSRRTFELTRWLNQRMATVYPQHPGYQAAANSAVVFPTTPPQPLPDALRGQKWQFVTLPVQTFQEMKEWPIDFGEAFPLQLLGLAPDTPIPGLIIYSPRALAIAAWMSGLELATLQYDQETKPCLVLETGVIDRWIMTPLSTPELQAEAAEFETTKQAAQGVHFLAVQSSPAVQTFAGFWLLRDV
jgi:hypothetical protein